MNKTVFLLAIVWAAGAAADSRMASCKYYDDKEGEWVTAEVPVNRVLEYGTPAGKRHDRAEKIIDNMSEDYKSPYKKRMEAE